MARVMEQESHGSQRVNSSRSQRRVARGKGVKGPGFIGAMGQEV